MKAVARKDPGLGEIVAAPRGSLTDEQARLVFEELKRLKGDEGIENLDPRVVVEAARDPDSPLHPYFTWDVEKAAAKYWLHQARTLISNVRYQVITHDGFRGAVRTLVSVRVDTPGNEVREVNAYVFRDEARKRPKFRKQMVEKAQAELRQWCNRWCDLGELDSIRIGIQKALDD